jgi:molybdate/tungstate transport system substrate-binding protein
MRALGLRHTAGSRLVAALAAGAVLAGAVTLVTTDLADAATTGAGSVAVLYAGSLTDVMTNVIGPGFTTSTGITVNGFAGGSSALATDIKGGVQQGDVFVSASPAVNLTLAGPTNGSWVSWYVKFATSPLVLGYNPKSTFAADLKTQPWYKVVTKPGFLLGRTDPALDPKGVLAVQAVNATAKNEKDPSLTSVLSSTATVFPEETLVGRLQSGQLDAGFFYAAEAKAAGIPTVPLGSLKLSATYTVTVLRGAPNAANARAFVRYLLGPKGRAGLQTSGFVAIRPPKLVGRGAPSALARLASSG